MSTPSGSRTDRLQWDRPPTEPVPAEPPPDAGGRGGLVAIVVVAALALVAAGLAALFTGGGDSGGEAADDCRGAECGAGPSQGLEPQEMEIPDDRLGVRSLGALTPVPPDGWTQYRGPGADELLAEDAHALSVSHTDTWISYMMVGRLGEFALEADPEDLHGTATEIVDTWVFDYPYSSATGVARSEPELTDTVVDSHPAVLLETRVTWDSLENSPDTYEDVALLLVDPGQDGIFLGVAAVPESGTQRFEPAVEALLATTFRHNTFLP
ncbi:hypothetical protein [Glycomyces xiaoerkulensis]|uniref:hypothetical protein n=1 Tax=Glycomyces xiaoerkulensis TaxID=2038139 RepID=UPI000C265664|nr:hypothetical protein [Glycomyces xiaoerkulensis]